MDAHRRIFKDTKPLKSTKPSEVLLCFSVLANTESILSMKKPKRGSVVPILDGLRFFSTCWVILGHGMSEWLWGVDNFGSTSYILDEFTIMAVVSGAYAVDTFFFIGGLLVCFLGMKFITRKKGYGPFDIPLMYLQRYLRLTPPYAFVLLMSISLFKYLGAGPYWAYYTQRVVDVCVPTWWTNLLYINEFYKVGCMGWSWYLSVDMFYYIMSPFLILLLYKSRKLGLGLLFLLFVGCITINAYLAKTYNVQPKELDTFVYLNP